MARPKTRRLEADPVLRAKVVALLEDGASPRQINARLRWAHPDNEATRISHEQFYQASYVQGAGSLRQQLRVDKALRSGRTRRLPRSPLTGLPRRSNRSWIEAARISARPPEADDRAVPGHWEGDLVIGAGRRSVLITLAGARQPLRAHTPPGRLPRLGHRYRRPADHGRRPAPGRAGLDHLGPGQ